MTSFSQGEKGMAYEYKELNYQIIKAPIRKILTLLIKNLIWLIEM